MAKHKAPHPWRSGFNKTKAKNSRPIGGRGDVNTTVDLIVKRERSSSKITSNQ